MEIQAKVVAILPPRSGVSKRTGEPWTSQTIVVEYQEGQYPSKLALQNMSKADEFGQIPVGATGRFRINPNSREYNGQWYTQCDCFGWDLDVQQPAPAQPQPQAYAPQQPQVAKTAPAPAYQQQPSDPDLPF